MPVPSPRSAETPWDAASRWWGQMLEPREERQEPHLVDALSQPDHPSFYREEVRLRHLAETALAPNFIDHFVTTLGRKLEADYYETGVEWGSSVYVGDHGAYGIHLAKSAEETGFDAKGLFPYMAYSVLKHGVAVVAVHGSGTLKLWPPGPEGAPLEPHYI